LENPVKGATQVAHKPHTKSPGESLPENPRPAPIAIATGSPQTPALISHCGNEGGLSASSGVVSKAGAATGETTVLAPDNIAPGAADPAAVPPATDAAHDPATLNGFQKAWGTSNAAYDLNSDGTVNMDDLLQYLANQPTPHDVASVSQTAPSDAVSETV